MFIDSSAIAKYLTREPGWEEVRRYIYEAATIPLALVELGSALIKKKINNELSYERAAEILAEYNRIAIFVDQNRYIENAFKIAHETGVSMYDGLFIAAAMDEGSELVSCDGLQLKAANAVGVKTIKC